MVHGTRPVDGLKLDRRQGDQRVEAVLVERAHEGIERDAGVWEVLEVLGHHLERALERRRHHRRHMHEHALLQPRRQRRHDLEHLPRGGA
jgi:hypothetical protein